MSSFKEWCKNNGFCNTKNITHVLMDGGTLSVPFERLTEFYNRCIKAVHTNERIYVVEQKTVIYNFFLDIDYTDKDPLTINQIEQIVKVICEEISSEPCLISTSRPKPKGDMTKTGVHLNWSKLAVDQNMALDLMNTVISTLNNKIPNRQWEKFIDSSVYGNPATGSRGSGFRLPWNHKIGKHEACMGKGCGECNFTGKHTESEYLPIYIYKNNMISKTDPYISMDKLLLATVRNASDHTSVTTVKHTIRKRKPATTTSKNIFDDDNIIDNANLMFDIQEYINKYIRNQSNLVVERLYRIDNHIAVRTNSRWCENINGEHSSNHIYFVINIKRKIMYQKCFCNKKNTNHHRGVTCKEYTGPEYNLTNKITSVLSK